VWAVGVGWAYLQPATHAELSESVRAAVGSDVRMFHIINPSSIGIPERFQEITVFLIVAMTLALAVRRSNALLISHAGIEANAPTWRAISRPTSSSSCLGMMNR
jgi:adenylate cyclase